MIFKYFIVLFLASNAFSLDYKSGIGFSLGYDGQYNVEAGIPIRFYSDNVALYSQKSHCFLSELRGISTLILKDPNNHGKLNCSSEFTFYSLLVLMGQLTLPNHDLDRWLKFLALPNGNILIEFNKLCRTRIFIGNSFHSFLFCQNPWTRYSVNAGFEFGKYNTWNLQDYIYYSGLKSGRITFSFNRDIYSNNDNWFWGVSLGLYLYSI